MMLMLTMVMINMIIIFLNIITSYLWWTNSNGRRWLVRCARWRPLARSWSRADSWTRNTMTKTTTRYGGRSYCHSRSPCPTGVQRAPAEPRPPWCTAPYWAATGTANTRNTRKQQQNNNNNTRHTTHHTHTEDSALNSVGKFLLRRLTMSNQCIDQRNSSPSLIYQRAVFLPSSFSPPPPPPSSFSSRPVSRPPHDLPLGLPPGPPGCRWFRHRPISPRPKLPVWGAHTSK